MIEKAGGIGSAGGAAYEVLKVEFGRVLIKDMNRGRSVTNAAEAVVAHLVRTGIAAADGHVLYIDSDGRLDRLLVAGGEFAGFAAGTPEDQAWAEDR